MFRMNDYVDDIKDIMAKERFLRISRFWIVMADLKDSISRRSFPRCQQEKAILVDHNERSQAVHGIEEAETIEIIDHHRLGDIETVSPITFRNQPVGCTATIINQTYEENEDPSSKRDCRDFMWRNYFGYIIVPFTDLYAVRWKGLRKNWQKFQILT